MIPCPFFIPHWQSQHVSFVFLHIGDCDHIDDHMFIFILLWKLQGVSCTFLHVEDMLMVLCPFFILLWQSQSVSCAFWHVDNSDLAYDSISISFFILLWKSQLVGVVSDISMTVMMLMILYPFIILLWQSQWVSCAFWHIGDCCTDDSMLIPYRK